MEVERRSGQSLSRAMHYTLGIIHMWNSLRLKLAFVKGITF